MILSDESPVRVGAEDMSGLRRSKRRGIGEGLLMPTKIHLTWEIYRGGKLFGRWRPNELVARRGEFELVESFSEFENQAPESGGRMDRKWSKVHSLDSNPGSRAGSNQLESNHESQRSKSIKADDGKGDSSS